MLMATLYSCPNHVFYSHNVHCLHTSPKVPLCKFHQVKATMSMCFDINCILPH